MGIPCIQNAIKLGEVNEIPPFEEWLPYNETIDKQFDLIQTIDENASTAYLKKLSKDFRKKNSPAKYKELLDKTLKGINSKIVLPALQDYYRETISAIMTEGAAFRKNDLLDAIILANVSKKNLIITYDNGLIKLIKKRQEIRQNYKESLAIIAQLMD